MSTLIPLTSSLKINQGSHILYFYHSISEYVENAASYIATGIELGQYVVFIEAPDIYKMVLEKLGPIDMSKVQYVNNYDFYEMYQDFQFERVLTNLKDVFSPYVHEDLIVRLWGHVDWMSQDNIISKIHNYECSCDVAVDGLGYTTVCTYNNQTVPSNILLELMKSHEYLMTDDALVRSNFYNTGKQSNSNILPTLTVQQNIESEMDLYKQKLDFVHVVSHEVRNPLTVIKSYASLLNAEEKDEQRRSKLEAIINYAVVIDNEISHIINTEQMLSTDAFWQKKLILAKPPIQEVNDIMKIKAQTQNISLQTNIQLSGKEMILANLMGYKMIISNLLSNAIKYSFEGGRVYLNVHKEESNLLIEIKDKGMGMSAEQLNKLYQKYEKINQDQSGQGIGLFMVKKLVDHFQGTIEVDSQLDVGTTFRVILPIQG